MINAINIGFYPKFAYNTYNWITSPSFHSDIKQKISGIFWTSIAYWSIYNLVDSGLANVFALETLTHGTGPFGYIGINLNGADPNYGGGNTGSSVGSGFSRYIETSKNYFHVFKDSGFYEDSSNFLEKIFIPIGKTLLPKLHSTLSGMATFGYSFNNGFQNLPKGIIGGFAGFFTPTLKFRFTPEDLCLFENDPDYGGIAYRTTAAISSSHLGITGSLQQGINLGMFDRIVANPQKVLIGISLLAAAAVVAKWTYSYLHSSPKEPSSTDQPPRSCWQSTKRTVKALSVVMTIITLNTL